MPSSEHPSNMEKKVVNVNSEEKKKKSIKSKLFYWAEKILMVIGAITILYLLFSPSSSKQTVSKEMQPVVKEMPKDSMNTDTIKRDTLTKDTTNIINNKDGRTEETQKNSNDQPAS